MLFKPWQDQVGNNRLNYCYGYGTCCYDCYGYNNYCQFSACNALHITMHTQKSQKTTTKMSATVDLYEPLGQ